MSMSNIAAAVAAAAALFGGSAGAPALHSAAPAQQAHAATVVAGTDGDTPEGADGSVAPQEITDVVPSRIAGQPKVFDLGETANTPTVADWQSCDPGNPNTQQPTAGRQWSYYNKAHSMRSPSSRVTVTGWADAKGALRDVRNNTGMCSFMGRPTIKKLSGVPLSQGFLLIKGKNAAVVRIAARDFIVAVSVNPGTKHGRAFAIAQAKVAAKAIKENLEIVGC